MESFYSCLWRGGEKESRGERERERERESAEEEKTKKNFRDKQLQRSLGGRGRSRRRPRKEKKWKSSLLFFTREGESCFSSGSPPGAGVERSCRFSSSKTEFSPTDSFLMPPPPPSRFRRSFEREDSLARLSSLSSLLSLSFSAPRPLQQRPDSPASFRSLRARSASSRDQRENNNQDRIPFDMSDVGGR